MQNSAVSRQLGGDFQLRSHLALASRSAQVAEVEFKRFLAVVGCDVATMLGGKGGRAHALTPRKSRCPIGLSGVGGGWSSGGGSTLRPSNSGSSALTLARNESRVRVEPPISV